MALTVRPDDEVYQFDTVWLGPDEYTLPIQARYVAWGTWLTCFLLAAIVLIPLGGHGPGGVLGSLTWSVAASVVASRAVMLVVDHERPLRSLPQVFGSEARSAMAATRRGDRPLLLHVRRVRVRETPERVHAARVRGRERPERPGGSRVVAHQRPPASWQPSPPPAPQPVVAALSRQPEQAPPLAAPSPGWALSDAPPVRHPAPAPAPAPERSEADEAARAEAEVAARIVLPMRRRS